ncbi:MAG: hypothetical protein WCG75_02280, partial [Armatimonadota bacterium]
IIHSVADPTLKRLTTQIGMASKMNVVKDSNHTLINYDGIPFATVERTESDFSKQMTLLGDDPLASILSILDGNPDPNSYRLETSQGEKGTYVVTYTRAAAGKFDPKSAIHVIVDEQTDLPIESVQESPFYGGLQKVRTVYSYLKTDDDSLFSMNVNKKVYDINEGQAKLKAEWESVKSDSGVAPIYSASMTSDGSIWLTYGTNDVSAKMPLKSVPSHLIAGSTKYEFAWEFPASYQSKAKDFRVAGKQVVFAVFVPTYQPAKVSDQLVIQFGDRPIQKAGEALSEAATKTMTMTSEALTIPECMITFGYQDQYFGISTQLWHKKGDAREALGDLKGAIEAYETDADRFEKRISISSYHPLLRAADCYEKLGDLAKAKELREKCAEYHRSLYR